MYGMIEVFKTNVRQNKQAVMLLKVLLHHFPLTKINFDLNDCDKVLRIEGENICTRTIVELLNSNGYQCQVLE